MTIGTFRIRGATAPPQARTPGGDLVAARPLGRVAGGLTRGGPADELEVPSDAVARVELEDGFVLWSRTDDLVSEHGRSSVSRDGTRAWEFDRLGSARNQPDATRGERGLLGLGIKTLDFFGVDLEDKAASALGGWLETKRFEGTPPGIYRCPLDGQFRLEPLSDQRIPAAAGPMLVFLHGTGSSAAGSFSELWADSNDEGKALRAILRERYRDRAYALQHRTLTASPITNALDLVRALPDDAELDLVSHSRGGLVGELMCLGGCDDLEHVLTPDRVKALFDDDRVIADQLGLDPLDESEREERRRAYDADRSALGELAAALKSRRVRVKRFVRVACPARGTTLASGRLDRWFSALSYVASKATGSDVFEDCSDFLLGVVKKRTDPRTLPGLEAMMPGSAVTRLLQMPELVTTADLSVIAGDVEGDSLWSRAKLLMVDWFYGSEHDLVVNTGSMYGGLRRPDRGARFLRDQGDDVNHFSYFKNRKSIRWLSAGLTREDESDGGFLPIQAARQEAPRTREAGTAKRDAAAPAPLAVIVPGALGSSLAVDGEQVWLDYRALFRGHLDRLAIDRTGVQPVDLIAHAYGPLVDYLAETHRVEVFPYDWRLSACDAADKLAARLEAWLPELERTRQPVRIAAHSMGGLVVRAMIGDGGRGADVWRRILAIPNSRFLMLGTPNLGSWEAVRWLTGFNPTETKLSLLDAVHSTTGIIGIVSRFPGLLELLPFDDESPDVSRVSFWQTLRDDTKAEWPIADEATLRRVRATWDRLRASAVDSNSMIYVAGCQAATVIGYRYTDRDPPTVRKRLQFLATSEGDGTVTWRSGRLSGVPVWYVPDTAHDELCTRASALPGYLDLLTKGTTTRLPSAPPAARGADEPAVFLLPTLPPTDDIPDEAALTTMGFGGTRPAPPEDTQPALPPVRVAIRHGDLAYARHPILVGHYEGDTIVNAERSVDERLGGALSRRQALGLYPGPVGTHALFFNQVSGRRPLGALVLGLGQVGDLSPAVVETSVCDLLLDFALQIAQWPDDRFGESGSIRSAAVSCLLIGTGASGMNVDDSVESLLRSAIRANRRLQGSGLSSRVLVDEIEFVELYLDMALKAADALEVVLRDESLARDVLWTERIVQTKDGAQSRPYGEDAPGWWHRLEIVEDSAGGLRFIAPTDRARAEVTQSTGQLMLADGFIERASQSSAADGEIAKTLFEMLLPNRLKALSPRQTDLVLVVDPHSARYPWELLEDRWSATGRPPAIAAGLLRQLKTRVYRPRPAHATGPTAFVVGNPDLQGWKDFADLPAAMAEAQTVATALRAGGYTVEDCLGETTTAIVNGLHRNPWRILHLAGHGVHDFELGRARTAAGPAAEDGAGVASRPARSARVSGMVIGKECVLTPGDVDQMRWVPELVFINCCHLAKTLSNGEAPANRGRLAANLAIQFVEMGVKAVVAAGWAVDDEAANAFAAVFYREMLDGSTFGDAVRTARENIWNRFPRVNTWGAYQCYGDPGYTMHTRGAARPNRPPAKFHAPEELVAELGNRRESIRVQRLSGADTESRRTQFRETIAKTCDRMPEAVRGDWEGRSDVAAAIGFAYGEAALWSDAIDWLDRAMRAADGACSLRVGEQFANFTVRSAAAEWSAAREAPAPDRERVRDRLRAQVQVGIGVLQSLDAISRTEERLNLLGSAFKRMALIAADGPDRSTALADSGKWYARAFELVESRGRSPSYYAYTNAAIAMLIAARRGAPDPQGDTAKLLARAPALAASLRETCRSDENFWNNAGLGDLALVAVLSSDLPAGGAVPQNALDEVARAYEAAMARGASPREAASIRETIGFVVEMLGTASPNLADALRSLDKRLSGG